MRLLHTCTFVNTQSLICRQVSEIVYQIQDIHISNLNFVQVMGCEGGGTDGICGQGTCGKGTCGRGTIHDDGGEKKTADGGSSCTVM